MHSQNDPHRYKNATIIWFQRRKKTLQRKELYFSNSSISTLEFLQLLKTPYQKKHHQAILIDL